MPKPKPKTTRGGIPIECHFDAITPARDLRTNPRQCYRHGDDKIRRLRRTIKKAGWRRAIVVSNLSGCIVRGHCATAGAALDDDEVPVEYQSFASDADEMAYLAADNESAKGSDFDELKLYGIIEDLGGAKCDPDIVGMDADTFAKILDTLNPDDAKPRSKKSRLNYSVEFDDEDQREAFASWLNRLKAEMPDIPTVGARVVAAINRTDRDE